jgi:prepilin-type N-terminal cleavage/methylation domain-containing protein
MQRTLLNRRRRAQRGFSLLEIIVAISIIAMISAGITVAIVAHKKKADISLTTTNAQSIRNGVKTWWIDHDSGSCPTIGKLVSDGAIDKGKSTKMDAWGEAWLIKCEDNDAVIISKGPDKAADTEDDIRVPNG